jgi:Leucine-rich repeat (LRR) protein
LRELPECISALSSLTKLDVSNNLLSTMPKSISDMATLITADARQNLLSQIPNCIGILHKTVTSFDIRENEETLIHPPGFLANKGSHK